MYLDDKYETNTGVYVNRIGSEVNEPPGFVIDRDHGTDDFVFIHFSSSCTIVLGGAKTIVHSGGCILYSPQTPQWYSGIERSFSHDWFHCYGTEAQRRIVFCKLPLNTIFYPGQTGFITETVRTMCLEIIQKRPYWDETIALHLGLLLVGLARSIKTQTSTPHRTLSVNRDQTSVNHRICDIRLAILGAPEHPWKIEELARRASLSKARFSSLYKENFNISPIEDVIQIRLQKARWLLENTTLSIKGIAKRVGFEDPAYFSRLFKKRVGKNPSLGR